MQATLPGGEWYIILTAYGNLHKRTCRGGSEAVLTVVGIGQVTAVAGDTEANRARCRETIRAVASDGADLVVLPELVTSGYTLDPDTLAAAAEALDGPTVAEWQELAADVDMVIVGGFCEQGPGRPYNAVVAVGPTGPVLHYRKLHLFGGEKEVFAPGDLGLPVADTIAGRLGVCVCYDLRFVEVVRSLALRGVEIVCVPTAWIAGFDAAADTRTHGCTQSDGALLQANLNQVFIVCASQADQDGPYTFLGSSVLADPTGNASIGPRSRTEQWAGTCPIDRRDVSRAHDRGDGITPRADRRTDVYGIRYLDQDL
jgi:N-carbamoylputrescine amidase